MIRMRVRLAVGCSCAFAVLPAVYAGGVPAVELKPVEVIGERALDEPIQSATEGYVTADQLEQRPISRSGELLEFVPGLIVTQHSGEGKANQYFLRGFNLDHGTDFYTEVDGLPVNMRSHGHGQGYADINFIIPELIGSMEYRKGPYYANTGDFSAAGSANLRYVDELPEGLAELTLGEYGYRQALLAGSPTVGKGKLLIGLQAGTYDGPYDLDQNAESYRALVRYNQGTPRDGFTASLAGYSIDYQAPDQIPKRAVEQGLIDAFGFIDPSDGGDVRRYSANLEWRGETSSGRWRVQTYAMRYRLDLYSDFTYFLSDPGDADDLPDDQFEQFDDREVFGVNVRRHWRLPFGVPSGLEVGVQSRYDDIKPVGLYLTQQRRRSSTVREDRVREGSVAIYASSTQQWTDWFRSTLGVRGDLYLFDVNSDLAPNSGNEKDSILSPKLALVFGPWQRTQFYLNYGEGFHSNDARGTTIEIDPASGLPADGVDPLVRARGGELGINSAAIPNMTLSASLWALNVDSELVYVGDAGASEPSGASQRRGIELSAYWAPLRWLAIDADYAYSHARLDSDDGNRIPNSIEDVFSLGLTIPEIGGWSAGLRLRRLGAGPLVEDNSRRSSATTIVNTQLGYRFTRRCKLTVAVLNLFDSDDNDITYFYNSRLPGEQAGGIDDFHFHPVESRALRVSLSAHF